MYIHIYIYMTHCGAHSLAPGVLNCAPGLVIHQWWSVFRSRLHSRWIPNSFWLEVATPFELPSGNDCYIAIENGHWNREFSYQYHTRNYRPGTISWRFMRSFPACPQPQNPSVFLNGMEYPRSPGKNHGGTTMALPKKTGVKIRRCLKSHFIDLHN